MAWHVGRLIDHVHVRVSNFAVSKRFYLAVLTALEYPSPVELGDHYLQADELYVERADELRSHIHLAFQAKSREMVRRFYQAAIGAGGVDHGAPGLRAYRPGYYAAFVLDPDGNSIEAVYQGRTTRSAEAITVHEQT